MIKKRGILFLLIILIVLIIVITSMYIRKFSMELVEFHWSVGIDSEFESVSLQKLDDIFKEVDSNFYCKEKHIIESQYSTMVVSVYGTDENFFRFNKYPLIRGSYFLKKDIENNERYIIIGSSTSSALFNNDDIIGKEVELEGSKFTVIGVVEDESLLPINPFYEPENIAVISRESYTTLFPNSNAVYGEIRSDEDLGKKVVENVLSDAGVPVIALEIDDVTKYATQFKMNLEIVFFIIGLLLIIELIKKILIEYRNLISNIRLFRKKYYVKQWKNYNEYGITASVMKLILIFVLIMGIYKVISFEFFIDVYYDGSYGIDSFGDLFRWLLRELSIRHAANRTSITETIKLLVRIRTFSLVLFTILYSQIYISVISRTRKN